MAAPTYRSSASTYQDNGATSNPIVVNVPSGVVEGDWLIAINGSGSGSDRYWNRPSTDWTILATLAADLGAVGGYYRVYIKKATGSEPASYSFPANTTFIAGRVTLVAIADCSDHEVIPFVSAITGNSGSAGSTTSPTITPTEVDSLILRVCMHSRSGDVTSLTDNTKRVNYSTTAHTHVLYTQTASGATGTKAGVYTPTWHEGYGHIVLAFAPIAGPTADTRRFVIS